MSGRAGPPDHHDPFIGRAVALDSLVDELEVTGILTLTGPPGAGKSRWAAEVIRRPILALPDGPWWVSLAATTAMALAEQLAVAIEAPTSPGASAESSVLGHLRALRGLLVLDGCDVVRREAGELVDLIRRRCPGVRILLTCRQPLAVRNERVRSLVCHDSVDGSGGPGPSPWRLDDAVALFRQHAVAGPHLGIDEQSELRLCRAIAGVAMAVELVAARAVHIPPANILARLADADNGPATSGPATSGPTRSVGLTEVIRWSCGLLNDADRRILARLSVFRGAFSSADAEDVAGLDLFPGEVVAALGRLSETALVRRHEPATGEPEATPRFVMPAPISAFAAAELTGSGESARVRDRHAAHWARLVSHAEAGLQSRQQAVWVERLERDRDDLLAALDWLATSGDVECALRLAGGLGRSWWLGGRFEEGWRALRSVLARSAAGRRTVGRAAALHALGLATFWHETDAARAERSGACFDEAVQIYRDLGERHRLVWAMRDLGSHHNGQGDLARARELFGQSHALAREIGDVAAMGVAASYLGIAASYAGDRVEARQRLEEAAVLLSGRGGADELVRAQFFLACLECDDRNPAAARARFKAVVEGNGAVPTVPYVVGFALDGLARLAAAESRCADALRLAGAAAAAHARLGTSAGGAYTAYVARGLAEARRVVGERAAETYAVEGGRWTLAQAVACGFGTGEDPSAAAVRLRPRELEVLQLAGHGLGDAEIARRLCVSRRTVGNHLASAYRKLGVHSRTAALHVIRQRGLLAA